MVNSNSHEFCHRIVCGLDLESWLNYPWNNRLLHPHYGVLSGRCRAIINRTGHEEKACPYSFHTSISVTPLRDCPRCIKTTRIFCVVTWVKVIELTALPTGAVGAFTW